MSLKTEPAVLENGKKIRTGEFRLSFPHLFEPSDYGNKPHYSITMLFDKDSKGLALLQETALKVFKARFGEKTKKPSGDAWPFHDGDEKDFEGYENMIYVRAKSNVNPARPAPKVLKVVENKLVLANNEDIYPGCIAIATISPFAYDFEKKKGVAFGLGNIVKIRDDEPLGSRSFSENEFGMGIDENADGFGDEDDDAGF